MAKNRRRLSDNPIFDEPRAAIDVLAEAMGVRQGEARAGLLALIEAGYVVGPREPTNAMLLAYMESYGESATNPATVINAISKARKRWRAMGEKGSNAALSRKRLKPIL